MKNPWVIIGVITALLLGGAIWYSGVAAENNNVGIEILEHVKGNAEASVTLIEYSDFECPACASVQPILEGVMDEYGDDLRFEYKHFPLVLARASLHPNSLSAAVAAEAAGQQGKFFEYHDLLFDNQQTWSKAVSPNALFVQYAEQLELDLDQFRQQMKSSVLRDKAKADFAEGRKLGVGGTPSFFLNGKQISHQPIEEFIAAIAFAIDPDAAASSTDGVGAPAAGSGVRFGL